MEQKKNFIVELIELVPAWGWLLVITFTLYVATGYWLYD